VANVNENKKGEKDQFLFQKKVKSATRKVRVSIDKNKKWRFPDLFPVKCAQTMRSGVGERKKRSKTRG
jgi:hypothetical protein